MDIAKLLAETPLVFKESEHIAHLHFENVLGYLLSGTKIPKACASTLREVGVKHPLTVMGHTLQLCLPSAVVLY